MPYTSAVFFVAGARDMSEGLSAELSASMPTQELGTQSFSRPLQQDARLQMRYGSSHGDVEEMISPVVASNT